MSRLRNLVFVPIALVLVGSPLNAQVLNRERAPLDSTTQAYHDAVIAMRDTLLVVNAAATDLSRAISNTSTPVVVQRSQKLRAACSGASEAAASLSGVFDGETATPNHADRVRAVFASLGELASSLENQCTAIFNDGFTANPDSLVGWAPYYSRQVVRLSRAFMNSAYALAQVAHFRIEARY